MSVPEAAPPDAAGVLRTLEPGTTTGQALAFFDSLPPVTVAGLIGAWKGSGLATGNPLDGLLESLGWHGKRFDSADEAHPLLFEDQRGRFSVNPALVPVSTVVRFSRVLRIPLVTRLARPSIRLLRTARPHARLRMIEYRGVPTGTMSYDALPINDHFRAVDGNTLLAAMDLRGLSSPFMFVLRRE
jgi:GXWXG protein/uncharacterized protein DUF4334